MKKLRRMFDAWVTLGRPMLVRLHTGDVIAVALPGPVSPVYEAELTARLEDVFGHRHEILILTDNSTLSVVRDTDGPGQL